MEDGEQVGWAAELDLGRVFDGREDRGQSSLSAYSAGRNPRLLPGCYQTIPNHVDLSRAASVPNVEIFED